MATEIRVPTLGESVTEATIGRWLKKEGDTVAADEPLVELETDKVSVEVSAPTSGVLSRISAKEGDTVAIDAVLGIVGDSGAAKGPAKKTAEKPADRSQSAKAEAPAKSANVPGKDTEVRVPAAGESVTQADVGEWLKREGDAVTADETIVSLETDKASMDVAAPVSGVLKTIAAKTGETVEIGAILAVISGAGPNGAAKKLKADAAPSAAAKPAEKSVQLSPAPRRVVGEYGLDPRSISGTGKDGRVTKGDALAAARTTAPAAEARAPAPATPPAAPRELGPREERVRMTRLRQTIARRLKEAQETAAMLTTFNDVDMSAVIELRSQYKELFEKKHGVKLGFMSFFVKASIHALKEVPEVNAEIDGTDIIYKNHYDIAVAVGTDRGLVVPVLKDADRLSLAGIEAGVAALGQRAREGTLALEDMQGGTFTISNGGIYGSLLSTPILNPPQSGVLGMHRIEERAVVRGKEIVIRPMMYLALSYDHRIVDGKGAVTFLLRIKENLEDPQRFLLDL